MKIILRDSAHYYGGEVVELTAGDSLDDVPESHRDLLTPDILAAFADPPAYFRDVADRAPLQSFGTWLRALTAGTWQLDLVKIMGPFGREHVGFRWQAPGVASGNFLPGAYSASESVGHPDFRLLYSVIRHVDWAKPCRSGGLFSPQNTYMLKGCELPEWAPGFPPETTTIFGHTECGDMFVHTAEGVAGFYSFSSIEAYVIGSIPEMLEWIFGILMADDSPQFEYDPKKR